jgi:hypothetical protein
MQLTALAEFNVWVRPTRCQPVIQPIYAKLELKLIDFLRSKVIQWLRLHTYARDASGNFLI